MNFNLKLFTFDENLLTSLSQSNDSFFINNNKILTVVSQWTYMSDENKRNYTGLGPD